MGFNKRYVPDLETLKEIRKKHSNDEEFLKSVVGKSDVLMGPPDSIDFLDYIRNKFYKGAKDKSRAE